MSQLIGRRIRHFRVVDLLGKGGMGEVYAGYDEMLERRVALKSISAEHRLNEEAKARFLREARVLSQLAHPNICQIFDYLEEDDAHVLVLELIEGENLSRAINSGLEERLKLRIARQIAEVLVAAHERNIVHRDLKPDNVMITTKGDVKVLDFGLSRLTASETAAGLRIHEETLKVSGDTAETEYAAVPRQAISGSDGARTRAGMIMGTPGYMSPEQASGEPATPASDMYSLGLLLQQLFTGQYPVARGGSLAETIRRSQASETLPVEGVDPDVTALINRLKSAAPGARPSAIDTLERIDWIIDRPNRKRKRAFLAAAVMALVIFGAFMTVQTIRATRAERIAEREAEVANNVTRFMVDLFDVSDPFEQRSGESVTARELLDKGAARIDHELRDQPQVQARLMSTIGTVYRRLGLFDAARPQLEGAVAVAEKAFAPHDLNVAEAKFALGSLYSDLGNYEAAEKLLLASLSAREKMLPTDDAGIAEVLNNLAAVYARQGNLSEAQLVLERSVDLRERAFGSSAPILADALNNLALLHSMQGRASEAERLYNRSLGIRENAFGPEHPRVADSLTNLAVEHLENGRVDAAEPLAQRAVAIFENSLGPDHPHLAHGLNNLAEIRHQQRKYAEAEELYRRSLAIYEKTSGADHPDVAYELTYLGKLYLDQNRLGDAESSLRRAVTIYEKSVGNEHPDTALALFTMAAVEARRGNKEDAIAYLRRAFPAGAGAPWAAGLKSDPAFADLQDHPEFVHIVKLAHTSE